MADLDRLKDIVEHAARNSPYLAELWADAAITSSPWSRETFERIPFTTKEDLRRGYPDRMLAVPWREVVVVHESSGTTGVPTPAFFTRGDLDEWHERMLFNSVALTADDVVLVKTPYSMLTTAHQMHGAAQLVGATVVPAGNRTELMPYGRVLRLLRDYQVTVAYCIPVELMLFARRALLEGFTPSKDFPALRAAVVNGEVLSDAKRRFLEQVWSVPLFPDYGSTETTTLGGACAHGTLHLWAERFHFEVYDEASGTCSEYGDGEIVVTSYHRRATPIVRYRLGDVVTVRPSSCPCGSDRPEIVVHGRRGDAFTVAGRELYPGEVEDVVYGALLGCEPTLWSGELRGERLTLSLESTETGQDEVANRIPEIERALPASLGLDARVRLLAPGTLMSQDLQPDRARTFKPTYLHKVEP